MRAIEGSSLTRMVESPTSSLNEGSGRSQSRTLTPEMRVPFRESWSTRRQPRGPRSMRQWKRETSLSSRTTSLVSLEPMRMVSPSTVTALETVTSDSRSMRRASRGAAIERENLGVVSLARRTSGMAEVMHECTAVGAADNRDARVMSRGRDGVARARRCRVGATVSRGRDRLARARWARGGPRGARGGGAGAGGLGAGGAECERG